MRLKPSTPIASEPSAGRKLTAGSGWPISRPLSPKSSLSSMPRSLNVPRSFVPILTSSLVLCWPSLAAGANENHGSQIEAVQLRKGDSAPFDGQLLSTEAAIRVVLEDEHSARRCSLEIGQTRKLGQLALEHARELRFIDGRACQKKVELADRALSKADPWYRAPVFVAGVTFLGTLAIVWLTGQATP